MKYNPNTVVKYIGRYLGRLVITTSRIDHYDKLYARHRDIDKETQELLHSEFPTDKSNHY